VRESLQAKFSGPCRWILAAAGIFLSAGCAELDGMGAPQKAISKGLAKQTSANISPCPPSTPGFRAAPVGIITALDGSTWTVPGETVLQGKSAPLGTDLYNLCNKVTPKTHAQLPAVDKLPVIEVDADGEIITGYVAADNYFELYVNGKLVAFDPVPYSPSNASIVRFKVKRPYTLVFKVVDWEEDLGVGTELGNANNPQAWRDFYMGDGGLVARFSDGTVTDSTWKAQSFYISPLRSPNDVVEKGNVHDSSHLGRVHPKAGRLGCDANCYAVHYRIPANYASPAFNDSNWPNAFEYTEIDVGVENMFGYALFRDLYKGARWIWTANLVFDNVIIARKTVR
jgi:hypothetical protein